MQDTAQTPAIGYSITANLADDRQIVFQHFVAQDDTVSTVNARIDFIMGLIDRQKAIFEIPKLREEKANLEGQLALAERDRGAVELEHQQKVEARNRQIIELRAQEEAVRDEAYKAHVAAGRRGEFKPGPRTQGDIDRVKADVQKLVEAAVAAESERDVALHNLDQNLKMRRLRIKQIDEKLADLARLTQTPED